jgi:hypothetical protein
VHDAQKIVRIQFWVFHNLLLIEHFLNGTIFAEQCIVVLKRQNGAALDSLNFLPIKWDLNLNSAKLIVCPGCRSEAKTPLSGDLEHR